MLYVLIPSKNNAEILLTQIKILREIFPSEKDVRIIVLDNSSHINQAVADICKTTDWIYDNNDKKLSVSANFNRGIDYVKKKMVILFLSGMMILSPPQRWLSADNSKLKI